MPLTRLLSNLTLPELDKEKGPPCAGRSTAWRNSFPCTLYDGLVEEALCFGWIDSQLRRVDDDRVMQWFSPRRPGGIWSALNEDRIERLVGKGLMTARGQAAIDAATADGSWSQIDDVDALVTPADLDDALAAAPARGSARL